MATHTEKRTIQLDEGSRDDALVRALDFYEANGYSPEPTTGDDELVLVRGDLKNGWWTSDMTELHATTRVMRRGDLLVVSTEVDTTGQFVSDEDRAFWRKELDCAASFVLGEHVAPEDLRPEENKRAAARSRSSVSSGLYGMFVVGFAIIMLALAYQFFLRLSP